MYVPYKVMYAHIRLCMPHIRLCMSHIRLCMSLIVYQRLKMLIVLWDYEKEHVEVGTHNELLRLFSVSNHTRTNRKESQSSLQGIISF